MLFGRRAVPRLGAFSWSCSCESRGIAGGDGLAHIPSGGFCPLWLLLGLNGFMIDSVTGRKAPEHWFATDSNCKYVFVVYYFLFTYLTCTISEARWLSVSTFSSLLGWRFEYEPIRFEHTGFCTCDSLCRRSTDNNKELNSCPSTVWRRAWGFRGTTPLSLRCWFNLGTLAMSLPNGHYRRKYKEVLR